MAESNRHIDLTRNRIGPLLKVWWKPQIPMKSFEVMVDSFAVAKALLETLAQYDRFQFDNNIKPDYANAGGLMILEDGGWTDWYAEEDGRDFDDLLMEECWDLDRKFYNQQLEDVTAEAEIS